MTALITIDRLTKMFKTRKALDGISFSIEEGALFGFIGPNGAGKTTTIRILTTLLQPTSGAVTINGYDVMKDREAVRRQLGYIPDFFGLYNDMTVWEYMDFFARCYDIPQASRSVLISDLLTLVDLTHRRDGFVNNLSRGMKQRLGLARALIHDPRILILDEPAAGLDPRARVEFRALLKELQRMGKTIFFSSHILADVDELCTDVGIIEAGHLVACGNLKSLRTQMQASRIIYLTIIGDHLDEAKLALSYIPEVTGVTHHQNAEGDWELELSYSGDKMGVSALIARLVSANIPLISFREEAQTLEDMFMQLTKGIVS
jgi:ABC-2 type transport system ATP-binding protein